MNTAMNAVHATPIGGMTINTSHINAGINVMDDDLSEPSSPESGFDTTDLLQSACNDEVTAQLAASGQYLSIFLSPLILFKGTLYGSEKCNYLYMNKDALWYDTGLYQDALSFVRWYKFLSQKNKM